MSQIDQRHGTGNLTVRESSQTLESLQVKIMLATKKTVAIVDDHKPPLIHDLVSIVT
jgi:hypothetical protein